VIGGEAAESPPNCDSAASELLPCYSYVTGADVKPPGDCCSGLSGLNTNSPTCLCQLITQLNGSSTDPSVNITKAFNLPKDCAITLKTSDCPGNATGLHTCFAFLPYKGLFGENSNTRWFFFFINFFSSGEFASSSTCRHYPGSTHDGVPR
jgi:hypothetical protein